MIPLASFTGKTMAEACEAALARIGAARASDVADCLAMMFEYGEGGRIGAT